MFSPLLRILAKATAHQRLISKVQKLVEAADPAAGAAGEASQDSVEHEKNSQGAESFTKKKILRSEPSG